jgi:hypothetical protein
MCLGIATDHGGFGLGFGYSLEDKGQPLVARVPPRARSEAGERALDAAKTLDQE